LAEGISHALAQRRAELDALRDKLGAESQRKLVSQADFLGRIRNFFDIG
jgi:hypothetical protein